MKRKRVVNSPCVRNCCLDDKDICIGCFRTLQEILDWSESTPKEKHEILQRCWERKKLAQSKED
ncbi:DUF1289 domain-containing protein [Vibrio sp. HN007]|uniref:DUF1289 domain-containing protein n=1 Tax=Vibrio iocasae TaxID=3098914 RepID=UPI0035D4FEAB